MTAQDRDLCIKTCNTWAGEAMRNLAFAYKPMDGANIVEDMDENIIETDLIFLGIVSMLDPPREEVLQAMQAAYQAHVDVAIITGDHALTAQAIAQKVGIESDGKSLVLIQ